MVLSLFISGTKNLCKLGSTFHLVLVANTKKPYGCHDSLSFLNYYSKDGDEFLIYIVTGEETWIHVPFQRTNISLWNDITLVYHPDRIKQVCVRCSIKNCLHSPIFWLCACACVCVWPLLKIIIRHFCLIGCLYSWVPFVSWKVNSHGILMCCRTPVGNQ